MNTKIKMLMLEEREIENDWKSAMRETGIRAIRRTNVVVDYIGHFCIYIWKAEYYREKYGLNVIKRPVSIPGKLVAAY